MRKIITFTEMRDVAIIIKPPKNISKTSFLQNHIFFLFGWWKRLFSLGNHHSFNHHSEKFHSPEVLKLPQELPSVNSLAGYRGKQM